MSCIDAIFSLAREAIDAPNQIEVVVCPCRSEGYKQPDTRIKADIDHGEEYDRDTVWVASILSDDHEYAYGIGDSASAALKTLRFALMELASKRIRELKKAME